MQIMQCHLNIKVVLYFIILLTTYKGYSQFSKTHYIPPITANLDHGTSLPKEQYIYISTPSTTPFNVKVMPVGGAPVNYSISNASPIEYVIREKTLGETNLTPMFSQFITPSSATGSKFNNLGYIIEAEDQVYVSVRILAGANYEQAGALVSKGQTALGTTFRVGTFPTLIKASDQNDFINGGTGGKTFDDFLSFVSVMATEDNTDVSFSDFSPGVSVLNGTPTNVNLNNGESYIIALQSNEKIENFDGLIGVLVSATKPIAVNCGSFNGTSHDAKGARDIGIDQIVPIEHIGQEYIFVKARGQDSVEKPLIVAHQDNTEIFINGGGTPVATINAGDYYIIDGALYGVDGNIYVNTSNDVYAYQGIGGTTSNSNQGMFFVPPLNCQTPKIVDNIPFVNNLGQLGVINIYESDGVTIKETKDVSDFDGGISIVTETGSSVTINGTSIFSLGVPVIQQPVLGNPSYETYFIESLPDSINNITVESTGQLYMASFGANDKAAFGGYYSGFASKPEIILTDISVSSNGACIPNLEIGLNGISYYDSYQWYLDGNPISGATSISFVPTQPGYYYVEGIITGCLTLASDEIPVSLCPSDNDNDGVVDNIDVDNDNDGILNCIESHSNSQIDLSNVLAGTVSDANVAFTAIIDPLPSSPYLSGTSDSHLISNLPPNEIVNYQLNFASVVNIDLTFALNGSLTPNNDEEFSVLVPSSKTITLLDPDDQLLIDTDYDGIYEIGVTQFSSFDIRFKLKDANMPVGTGTFNFFSNAINSFSFIHYNETLTSLNSLIRFKVNVFCLALDSDNDGVENSLDLDSDNDGIPDIIEGSQQNITLSGVDVDQDGLDDIFNGSSLANSDLDTIPDFLDLDSDNDGIFDLEESGSGFLDTNMDGVIDNVLTNLGINGWHDSAETFPDSGAIGYTVLDTDADAIFNYIDNDSDGDGCIDVTEADFTANANQEIVGATFDANGLVLGSDGYITPNPDYLIARIITITTQPINQVLCELDNASFNIVTDADNIQWQISTDSIVWANIVDDATYSGANTNSLTISSVLPAFSNYFFRVSLSGTGYGCDLYSDIVSLTINQTAAPSGDVIQYFCTNNAKTLADLVVVGTNILWYADAISISQLPLTTTLVNGTTYYASQTDISTSCESINRLAITAQVQTSPTINNPGNQNLCDSFILPTITGINLTGNQAYFNESQFNGGTVITGPITNTQTVWVFDDNGTCQDEVSFLVTIINSPIINNSGDQTICDSYVLPAITGTSLSSNEAYYNDSQLNGGTQITEPIINSQTLWIYDVNSSCEDEVSFSITIINTPDIANQGDQSACDSYILPAITGTNLSGNEAYYDASQSSGGNLITGPITSTQTVWVYDANGICNDEESFLVTINTSPIADTISNVIECYSYELPSLSIGNQYFTESGGSGSELFAGEVITSSQTIHIYAMAVSPCISDEISFDVEIVPLPQFTVTDGLFCLLSTDPSILLEVTLTNNPLQIFDYLWEDPSGDTYTTETLLATEEGDYRVTLTRTDGSGCSHSEIINVRVSEKATITSQDITIEDFSNHNSITIDNSPGNLGLGDYEFALEGANGIYFDFQDNNYFGNLASGFYTLYAKDKNGCETASLTVSIGGYLKFFTPNGDGYHDFWKITASTGQLLIGTKIYIYNRYGKLLKQLDPGSGWDGTYAGRILPQDDYWFVINLNDGKVFKSHFALKR